MSKQPSPRRRPRLALIGTFAAPVLLSLPAPAFAQETPLLLPVVQEAIPAPADVAPGPKLDLASCRAIALERQPALVAARSSVAVAQARARGLEDLRVPTCLRRDLPIRRHQAQLGVLVAQAQLVQAESETTYNVTRTYLGVVYAKQQLGVANRALAEEGERSLKFLRKLAQEIYESRSRPDVKRWNVEQIEVYIKVAQGRRQEALEGIERARAGLREAMGVPVDFAFDVADVKLPDLNPAVDQGQVLALALDRRGEISQAAVAFDIVSYEAKAQATSCRPKKETFASASDIHAQPVPQGVRDGEYRPAAVGFEMPPLLAGTKSARVEQANALAARAGGVSEKTRNLVALEATAAYLRWKESSDKLPDFTQAAEQALKVYVDIRNAFNPQDKQAGKPTLEELLNAAVQATQLELQANQARYLHLLNLATLERVTAGGFQPGFGPPAGNENGNQGPNAR